MKLKTSDRFQTHSKIFAEQATTVIITQNVSMCSPKPVNLNRNVPVSEMKNKNMKIKNTTIRMLKRVFGCG